MNAAVIYENEDGDGIKIRMINILTGDTLNYDVTTDVDVLFSDRLVNMKGFKYKILAFQQRPRLTFDGNEWIGFDKLFMDVATKLQNASYSIQTMPMNAEDSSNLMLNFLSHGVVDLCLNTVHFGGTVEMNVLFKSVNTFDLVGYCALIPAPSRVSFLKYVLAPFDASIWTILFVTVAIFAVIWRIFKKYSTSHDFDSAGHFVFGIIALFFLQALPFRRNRSVLTFVTQLFVFTMLILGNSYQSLLISLISEPHFGSKISTIDEMIERFQNYKITRGFGRLLLESNFYPNMEMASSYDVQDLITGRDIETSSMNGTVFMVKCDSADYVMNLPESTELRSFFYILPQKFYSTYENYLTSRSSPFNKRLNEISLKVFETGIRHHWEDLSPKAQRVIESLNGNMLQLNDLFGVFYIFGICLSIAIIVFFMELLQFRLSDRGAPAMLVRVGRLVGKTIKRRKTKTKLVTMKLEQNNLED